MDSRSRRKNVAPSHGRSFPESRSFVSSNPATPWSRTSPSLPRSRGRHHFVRALTIAIAATHAADGRGSDDHALFSGTLLPGALGEVADFDGDGIFDRMAWQSTTLEFYRGLGDGSFAAASATTMGSVAMIHSLAADVDADGFSDFVNWSPFESWCTLIRGGASGIQSIAIIPLASPPQFGLAIANFAATPHLDVATIGSDALGQTILRVYVGSGNGSFLPLPHQSYGTSGFDGPLAGDFDGDSDTDLACASDTTLVILENQGQGTFLRSDLTPIPNESSFEPAASGNFDSDLAVELLVNSTLTGKHVRLDHQGVGYASSTPIDATTLGSSTSSMQVVGTSDLDHDGWTDLLVSVIGDGVLRIVALRASTSPTGFDELTQHPITKSFLHAFGDFDGDGATDCLSQASPIAITFVSDVLAEDPYLKIATSASSVSDSFTLGDFDRDGDIDVVSDRVGGGPSFGVRFNDGSGGLGPITASLDSFVQVATIDVPNTPGPDLIGRTLTLSALQVLRNDGTGAFPNPEMIPVPSLGEFAAADVNHDSWPDVVCRSAGSLPNLRILFGGPSGFWFGPTFAFDDPRFVLADANGDGEVDVISVRGPLASLPALVRVHTGNGAGQFTLASQDAIPQLPADLVCSDFDQDGRDDVAMTFGLPSSIFVLHSNGAGFDSPQSLLIPTSTSATPRLDVGELNGDPWPDLIANHEPSRSLTLYLGTSSGTFVPGPSFLAGASQIEVADMNGDALPDLVLEAANEAFLGVLLQHPFAVGSVSYGVGKPGSLGTPTLSSLGPPLLGTTTGVRLEKGLPGVLPILFVSGTSAAIPFDLGTLLVAPIGPLISLPAFASNGITELQISIPADPSLCGARVFFQSLHVDPLAIGSYHTAQSNGLSWTIGL